MIKIRYIKTKCKVCGVEVKAPYEDDPDNPVPFTMLDQFAKMLTCDACMIKTKHMKQEQEDAPVTPQEQSSLPYNDN